MKKLPEVEAWFDSEADSVLIKVRIWEAGAPYPAKRGMIFRLTSEQIEKFPYVAEGCYYPKQSGDTLEFVGTEDSIEEDEICNDGLDMSMCCNAPTKRVSDSIWICTKCGK